MGHSQSLPFPPHAPRSLHDHAVIADGDWQAFRGLNELRDHWQRPAWPDGASAYYWMLDLSAQTQLRSLVETCQHELADLDGFDMVPLNLLHLTVLRAGSIDTIGHDQLDSLVSAAELRRCWPPASIWSRSPGTGMSTAGPAYAK
jgi:hypothetical protein